MKDFSEMDETSPPGDTGGRPALAADLMHPLPALETSGHGSSFALAEGTNTFTSGVVDGYPLFGVSELDSADADAFEVDMWWTCGGPADAVSRPTGYVVDLNAIGCGVDQKLVLRKHLNPDRVTIEPYGAPSETKSRALVPANGGERFHFSWGDMHTKVKITSTTPSQMQATIELLQNNDVNICTAGTYTFPAL